MTMADGHARSVFLCEADSPEPVHPHLPDGLVHLNQGSARFGKGRIINILAFVDQVDGLCRNYSRQRAYASDGQLQEQVCAGPGPALLVMKTEHRAGVGARRS